MAKGWHTKQECIGRGIRDVLGYLGVEVKKYDNMYG
jgi:hypothetical protein